MKIAGLDIGTTGCKCTVFDEQGQYIEKAYRDYTVSREVGSHEIDLSFVLEAVWQVISELTVRHADIAGIGVTSFGETFVMTDKAGKPLHKAMLYTDPKGTEECRKLVGKLGEKEIAHITGLRPHEMYSISKMMWIKEHEPEIYKKARHVFLMEDYVVYQLTGIAQIDYSLATRTMAFDIRSLTWSKEIFDVAGIDLELMSEVVPAGTLAGTVTAETSIMTGLNKNTRVISISHDQVAAAVGAGAFDGNTAVDGAGTVECLTPIYDKLPEIDSMYQGYFAVVPYVIPGKYVAYAFSYTGGALMQWCVDTLAKKEKLAAPQLKISTNTLLEQEYALHHWKKNQGKGIEALLSEEQLEEIIRDVEPSGLLVLPHFAGAATPYMDTGAKGAILGLTISSTVEDIYRACMEGVAFEMYLNYQELIRSGIHFKRMNATGGGAHSKVWMQMKADILNLPVTALKTLDAGTVGSAMLTGIAIGVFKNLEDAAAHMVEEARTYEPREEMHEKYMEVYERYRKVYLAIRPLMN